MTNSLTSTWYKRIQEIIPVENNTFKPKSPLVSKIIEEENMKIINNIPYDWVKGIIIDFTT